MSDNRWMERFFRPIIIAAMMGAVFASVVRLAQLFFPDWHGNYLIAATVIASLEAHYSHFLLKREELRGSPRLRFRLIELGMLYLLLRIGSYTSRGWEALAADLQRWPSQPHLLLLDPESLATMVLAFLAWYLTNETIQDLETIEMPLGEEAEPGPDPERILYAHRFAPREGLPLDLFTGRFLLGGVIILVVTGLSRISVTEGAANLLTDPLPRGALLSALLYFVLGLIMMAQIRYAALRRQWWLEEVPVSDEIPGHWVRYSLVLLGVAALVAFLLPTAPAEGILTTGEVILNLIFWVISLAAILGMLLVVFPFALLAWLLTRLLTGNTDIPPPTPPVVPPPPPPETMATFPGWYELVQALLFWLVAGSAILYVVQNYLRDHPEIVEALTNTRLIRRLIAWLRALAARLRRAGGKLSTTWLRLPRRPDGLPGERWIKSLRSGPRSPREQVREQYLATLRRAARYGLPRAENQTPDEYRDTLAPELPPMEGTVESLTRSFVAARYSQAPITDAEVETARHAAGRVRDALKARAQRLEDEERAATNGRQG